MTADQAVVVVAVLLWMFLVSCGVIEGVVAGWRQIQRWRDRRFSDRLAKDYNWRQYASRVWRT